MQVNMLGFHPQRPGLILIRDIESTQRLQKATNVFATYEAFQNTLTATPRNDSDGVRLVVIMAGF